MTEQTNQWAQTRHLRVLARRIQTSEEVNRNTRRQYQKRNTRSAIAGGDT